MAIDGYCEGGAYAAGDEQDSVVCGEVREIGGGAVGAFDVEGDGGWF